MGGGEGAAARPESRSDRMSLVLSIHPTHADSLASHVADQGFPVTRTTDGELHVLFPGSPTIFAAAVELDLWEARGGCASGLVIEKGQG